MAGRSCLFSQWLAFVFVFTAAGRLSSFSRRLGYTAVVGILAADGISAAFLTFRRLLLTFRQPCLPFAGLGFQVFAGLVGFSAGLTGVSDGVLARESVVP